ncbi:MAG TPA: hypothetical protein VJZ16_01070 [Syntrophales bacterium]|nr:hypothetical protein [Syntrophales bacterium]
MNRGYVRLWRKSLDAGWIRNHKLWAFWTYCLMKASHKEFDAIVGLQIVHLMPGQFIFGRKKAAEETGLTEREIRTILDFLRKAGNLTIKTTNKFSIISIINWNTYQGEEIENDQLNDQQRANKGPHTNTITHKIFLSDSIEVRLADLLLEKILIRNPNHKKPNLQTWAKDIDLMIRLDKRTPEDIRRIIEWCQADTFWQSNILSTAKLRKQFDQLWLKMGEVQKSSW